MDYIIIRLITYPYNRYLNLPLSFLTLTLSSIFLYTIRRIETDTICYIHHTLHSYIVLPIILFLSVSPHTVLKCKKGALAVFHSQRK